MEQLTEPPVTTVIEAVQEPAVTVLQAVSVVGVNEHEAENVSVLDAPLATAT